MVVKDELQEDEEEDQELLSLNEMDNFVVDVDDVVFDEPLDVNAEQLSSDEEEEADKSVLASPPASTYSISSVHEPFNFVILGESTSTHSHLLY